VECMRSRSASTARNGKIDTTINAEESAAKTTIPSIQRARRFSALVSRLHATFHTLRLESGKLVTGVLPFFLHLALAVTS